MNHRKVTEEERKQLQMMMLCDIDTFCRKNGIVYYLAYGTLLGAIRHKGFIPWDDDVDIMMPRPDLEKFKQLYKSDEFKYTDVDTEVGYEYPFPRLSCLKTYKKVGMFNKMYGVWLDIYPIDGMPDSKVGQEKYKKKHHQWIKLRKYWLRFHNRVIRYLPFKRSILLEWLLRHTNTLLTSHSYELSKVVHVEYPKVPLNKRIFDGYVEIPFESKFFYAPSGWDEFLKCQYGDYMKLPPEEDRHPYHDTNSYYWK